MNVSLIYGDYYFIEALTRYAAAYGRTNLTYTPNPGFTGTDTFTYQVCDSGGNCSTATVTVVVLNTNPVLTFNVQASLSPVTGYPIDFVPGRLQLSVRGGLREQPDAAATVGHPRLESRRLRLGNFDQ